MPLPSLSLDDRSYQELRDELVRRIPIYTTEWTDFNPSDPGITLIELFAFLGENLLFRFNQIPEATLLAFLKLLRIPLRPASAARALITVQTELGPGSLVPAESAVSAGAIAFETQSELVAWPVSIVGVCRKRTPDPQPGDEREFARAAIDAAELTEEEQPAYYKSEMVPAAPGEPGAESVDFTQAVDGMLWMAVLGEPGVTQLSLMADRLLNIGFVPDEEVLSLADVDACPGEPASTSTPETVFEFSTGQFDAEGQPIYGSLSVDGDTSRALTQQGIIRLKLPRDPTRLGVFELSDPDLAGTGNRPPQIEDDEIAAKVLFWIRAFRRKAADRPIPRTLSVVANATEVVQTRKARPEFLGTGTAQPGQTVRLIRRPVIADSLILEVEESGQFVPWRAVDGFEASSESDRHYVVDLEAGTIRFGNMVRGRAPQIGERIRSVQYRYGGGSDGNVAAGKIAKLDEFSDLKVTNLLPARGGAAGEGVAEALDRIPGELRRRDRAVTRGDFEEISLATPGANVGRADALPLFHPPTKKLDAAGVVSVVVWPREDRKHPNAPMPDRTLLREVCNWLDRRRLITTELWVIPPTYRKIAAAVGLQVKPGFGVESVRRWVELVMRQYLAPLPPFGPEGKGWPLGRTVIGRELEAAALQVEGVHFLAQDVRLATWNEATGQWVESSSNRVELARWEVPELAEITVVEGDPLTPGEALGPPDTGKVPVPIPTLKEEC